MHYRNSTYGFGDYPQWYSSYTVKVYTEEPSKEKRKIKMRSLYLTQLQNRIDEELKARSVKKPKEQARIILEALANPDSLIRQLRNIPEYVNLIVDILLPVEEYELCHQLKKAIDAYA